jgi:hypothetical protein
MAVIDHFVTYYEAFEATYIDDDWARLEPLFVPDAVYRVTGGTLFDCEIAGREAVFAGIKTFLDGFDRQCERRIDNVAPPELTEDTVLIHGAACYRRNGSPELTLRLDELIEYRDGLIVRITDTYPPGLTEVSREWLERWGTGLTLSYLPS